MRVRKSVRVDDWSGLMGDKSVDALPAMTSKQSLRVRRSVRVDAFSGDKEEPSGSRSPLPFAGMARARKSVRMDWDQLQAQVGKVSDSPSPRHAAAAVQVLQVPQVPQEEQDNEEEYKAVIEEARKCVGHGSMEGAFPEEWDAQLLVDCGRNAAGRRVFIFCPTFLNPLLGDPEELDRAFRFILLSMDAAAMHEKYDFIYCYLGMDWSDPKLAHRLRIAYDILPRKYAKHLRNFYILHPTSACRVTLWTFWAWISKRFWNKIGYVETIEELCQAMHPEDPVAQAELRRRFPQVVQRNDAERCGAQPLVTYGVPLRQLCSSIGVDFTDKTTGRWYPKLPPAVVFLCETMEREAADEDFCHMFDASADAVYSLVDTIDQGKPLGRDLPMGALWCALKLFLDCLPAPLLSFQAFEELQRRGIKPGDMQGQRLFLIDVFHKMIPSEAAFVALYLSSFLHTMCETAQDRMSCPTHREGHRPGKDFPLLTPKLAAQVFTPAFLRPRVMAGVDPPALRAAVSVVETLVRCAEEPDIWIGSVKPRLSVKLATSDTDSSSSTSSSDSEDS